ncbi:MAG: hypothetical protein EXR66_05675 [Dehalococcoidia bacterium]|nr:hypothetical protein [Dehalococcoidia bacterium]
MHAVLFRLKKDGIIMTDLSRRRNQYLWIKDEIALERELAHALSRRGKAPARVATAPDADQPLPPIGGAPRRVVFLEERVAELETAFIKLSAFPETLSTELCAMRAELVGIRERLDDLNRT